MVSTTTVAYIKGFLTVTATCLVIGLGVWQFSSAELKRQSEAREQIASQANTLVDNIGRRVAQCVYATFALGAFLREDHTNFTVMNFVPVAESLIKTHEGISNLQLAPLGVVKHIYPLVDETQDNRRAIGHNLMVDFQRRGGALATIKKQNVVVIGPVTLLQGGVAYIARFPVFSKYAPKYLPTMLWINNNVTQVVRCETDAEKRDNCSFPGPIADGIQTHFWGFATMLGLGKVTAPYAL